MIRKILLVGIVCSFCTCITAQIIKPGSANTISFKLSAINLPNRDAGGLSDPYVKIFTASGPSRHPAWLRNGDTGVVEENTSPSWPETFTFSYAKGTSQQWRFIVKDYDPGSLWDEHLGMVVLNYDDYMNEVLVNGTMNKNPIQVALSQPSGGILVMTPQ